MPLRTETQRTNLVDDYLLTWIEAFLIDRKARGTAKGTLMFYSQKLNQFTDYAEGQAVKNISQITPGTIRKYLIFLERTGHNAGGRHAASRALRAFLKWYEAETDEVTARCKSSTGDVFIRKEKGGKPRYVYLGRTVRNALRRYLKERTDAHPALWVSRYGDRLSYATLRGILTRRAKEAGIKPPAIHDFRRDFALAMLRAGVDIYTLAKLMGHEGIQVLQRYVKLTDADTKKRTGALPLWIAYDTRRIS